MKKANSLLIITFLTVIFSVLGFYGWYLLGKKTPVDSTGKTGLPSVSGLNAANLPGKLFGPEKTDKAYQLDNQKIIEWTNKYRVDENLPALTLNTNLASAAQAKTDDMFKNQYFEHVSPAGKAPAQLVLEYNYNYKFTGENLALGDFDDEKELVDAWMNSPGHRANIMNKDFTEIGVSADLSDYQGRTTWISVQEFGTQAPNCQTPNSTTAKQIDANKAEYQSLAGTLSTLSSEAQTLAEQANAKITQGNQIYEQTHDKTKAQPYWDEGDTLRTKAQEKVAEAQKTDTEMKDLYLQISQLVDTYNIEVNTYNHCIE